MCKGKNSRRLNSVEQSCACGCKSAVYCFATYRPDCVDLRSTTGAMISMFDCCGKRHDGHPQQVLLPAFALSVFDAPCSRDWHRCCCMQNLNVLLSLFAGKDADPASRRTCVVCCVVRFLRVHACVTPHLAHPNTLCSHEFIHRAHSSHADDFHVCRIACSFSCDNESVHTVHTHNTACLSHENAHCTHSLVQRSTMHYTPRDQGPKCGVGIVFASDGTGGLVVKGFVSRSTAAQSGQILEGDLLVQVCVRACVCVCVCPSAAARPVLCACTLCAT